MPELVDICDQDGHLTGHTMPRSEAHRTGAWHRSVIVWLINGQGQVLLQRRAEHLGAFPGLWDASVVGHVSAGDEPVPTAIRELREELTVQAYTEELQFIDALPERYTLAYGPVHQGYEYVFVLRRDTAIADLQLQAAEITAVRWMDAVELERELAEPAAATRYAMREPRIYHMAIEAARAAVPS